jgi:hypothetical protein
MCNIIFVKLNPVSILFTPTFALHVGFDLLYKSLVYKGEGGGMKTIICVIRVIYSSLPTRYLQIKHFTRIQCLSSRIVFKGRK